jgi:hypothetical protein
VLPKINAAHNQAARGTVCCYCHIAFRQTTVRPRRLVSAFALVLMLTAFYVRQRSNGMARKYWNVTIRTPSSRRAFSEHRWTDSKKLSLVEIEAGRRTRSYSIPCTLIGGSVISSGLGSLG